MADDSQAEQPAADRSSWWDREIFLDSNGGHCPSEIDVTGRARYLFFGPYLPLAPGIWRATISVRLCPDAARCRLALQFGAEPDYDTVDLEFGVDGDHVVIVEHRRVEPGLGQVRLWLKKAAFHGGVRLSGAAVERIGDLETSD
jgi:hypothetical protein